GKLNFSVSKERVEKLEKAVKELDSHIRSSSLTEETILEFNKGILQISRILVPLNYLKGDIFKHDPCYSPPCIPGLMKVDEFSTAKTETHEYFLLQNELTREINKVNYALLSAIRIVESMPVKLSL